MCGVLIVTLGFFNCRPQPSLYRGNRNEQAETSSQIQRTQAQSHESFQVPSTANSNPSFPGQLVPLRPKSSDIWRLLKEIGLVKPPPTSNGNVNLTRHCVPIRN